MRFGLIPFVILPFTSRSARNIWSHIRKGSVLRVNLHEFLSVQRIVLMKRKRSTTVATGTIDVLRGGKLDDGAAHLTDG